MDFKKAALETGATQQIKQMEVETQLCLLQRMSMHTSILLLVQGHNPWSIPVPLLPSHLLCSDHKSFEAKFASCSIIIAGEPNFASNEISLEICKHLENPWATGFQLKLQLQKWRAQCSAEGTRGMLLCLGYLGSVLAVTGIRVCWKQGRKWVCTSEIWSPASLMLTKAGHLRVSGGKDLMRADEEKGFRK